MTVYLYDKNGKYIRSAVFQCLPRIGESIEYRYNDNYLKAKVIDIVHIEDGIETKLILSNERIQG